MSGGGRGRMRLRIWFLRVRRGGALARLLRLSLTAFGLCRRGTVSGREARAGLALSGDQGCVFVRAVAVGAAEGRAVSNELVLVDVVGLGDPKDGSRPSLPRWAFDQVAARGWRFVAEYRVPEDGWPLEPYWVVVLAKEVQVVVEGGDGPLVFQGVDLVSWLGQRVFAGLYPELLRHLIDLAERELWLRVEEAA